MSVLFRYFLPVLFLLALGVAGILPLSGQAQPRNGPCDLAKSTAETVECLNRHKSRVQDQLQAVYDELVPVQKDPMRMALTKAQTAWLAYRDAECAWEATGAEPPALERVYELSCIGRLTEERIEALGSVLGRMKDGHEPPEFGPTPRWLNVLSYDYPAVFWRHGSWLSTDLDCDGEKEQILPGIKVSRPAATAEAVSPDGAAGEAPRTVASTITAYVAVAENPVTGRPRVDLITLPVIGADAAVASPHVCSTDIKLALTAYPQSKPKVEAEGEGAEGKNQPAPEPLASCKTALQVTDRQCQPVTIFWNGKNYAVIQALPQQVAPQTPAAGEAEEENPDSAAAPGTQPASKAEAR